MGFFSKGTDWTRNIPDRWKQGAADICLEMADFELTAILRQAHPGVPASQFLQGSSVLSLGCGSPESSYQDGAFFNDFEAWRPRYYFLQGASPILGLDKYKGDPLDADVYIHRRADIIPLLKDTPKLLDFVSDFIVPGTCALVECRLVFGWGRLSSKTFLRSAGSNIDDRILEEQLRSAAAALLREGGILLYNTSFAVNIGGTLTPFEAIS